MRLPAYPVEHEPVRASWGRQIVDYLRSITPRPSARILPRPGPGGTTFDLVERRRAAASTVDAPHPFKIAVAPSEDEENPLAVTVAAGCVHVFNLANLAIEEAVQNTAATLWAYLKYTHRTPGGAGGITAALAFEAAEKTPANLQADDVNDWLLIGKVTVEGSGTEEDPYRVGDIAQYVRGLVTVKDAKRGHARLWSGKPSELPAHYEILAAPEGSDDDMPLLRLMANAPESDDEAWQYGGAAAHGHNPRTGAGTGEEPADGAHGHYNEGKDVSSGATDVNVPPACDDGEHSHTLYEDEVTIDEFPAYVTVYVIRRK